VIIKNIKPFAGQHCETTATGSLLLHLGIDLSEPMLFGLGEGLNFIFWNMKTMDFPFIGGRIKTDLLTQNIARHLHLKLKARETSSLKKAWENVKESIDSEIPVGIKLDSYHLEYFSSKIHFAGHYVTIYGYDEKNVYLIDTLQQGGLVKTSLESFEMARNEKGPMSSKNLSYTIKASNIKYNLKKEIIQAINNNAKNYLNPPIKNISYKGILKASKEIIKWFKKSEDVKRDFKITAMLMEKGGTGGALFRNLYRDFLKESYRISGIEKIGKSYVRFVEIARLWREVSRLFLKAGESKDVEYINQASEILKKLADKEQEAMIILLNAD